MIPNLTTMIRCLTSYRVTAAIVNGKPAEDLFPALPPAAFPWLSFADPSALALPPYSCRLCMSQFPSVTSLQKHFTTAHYLNSVLNNNNINNNHIKGGGVGSLPPNFNWPALQEANGYHHHRPVSGGEFPPEDAVQTGPTDLSVSSSKHGKHKSSDDQRGTTNSKKSRPSPGRDGAAKHERDGAGKHHQPHHHQQHHHHQQQPPPQPPPQTAGRPAALSNNNNNNSVNNNNNNNNNVNKIQLPCPHCHLSFTHFEDYQHHVIGHFLMAAAEYACQECSTAFATSEHVQKHLMETHAQNFYRCMLCKEVFPTKSALKVHFSMNHGSEHRMFRCNNCTGASRPLFQTEIEFIDHLRNVHYSARSPPPAQTNLVSTDRSPFKNCSTFIDLVHFYSVFSHLNGRAIRRY